MRVATLVGGMFALLFITNWVIPVSGIDSSGRRQLLGTAAAMGCKCGCLIRNPFNGGCSQCKPDIECDLQKAAECSCPTGHVTNKWDKQNALQARFCHDRPCTPTGCCGKVRYAKQEGGTEALSIAGPAAMACVACTAGCAACAGSTASALIQQELLEQVASIQAALLATGSDLANKASEFGGNVVDELTKAIQSIGDEISHSGKVNVDSASAIVRSVGRCKFAVEPGMNTYNSKTCVFCCNCVNNLNAVRFYLAWKLDCTGGKR